MISVWQLRHSHVAKTTELSKPNLTFLLNWRTVTVTVLTNRSKGLNCCLDLLRAFAALLCRGVRPLHRIAAKAGADLELPKCHRQSSEPQERTDVSARIAAKAILVAWICTTPGNDCAVTGTIAATAEAGNFLPCLLSLPASAVAAMVPCPWHHKAKALSVDASCGRSTRAVRNSPSSISASSKVLSGSTRTRFLAVISLRYLFPKARSAPLSLHLEPWMKAEVWEA